MNGVQNPTNEEFSAKRALARERVASFARSSKNIPLENTSETRAEKNGTDATDRNSAETPRATTQNDQPRSIRKTLEKRRADAKQNKVAEKAGAGLAETVSQTMSARLLSLSWISLAPSFGLTLLYINFHFFMAHMLKNKRFCKFGEEWIPKVGGVSQGMAGYLGPVEILGMFVFDACLALLIGTLLFLLILIVRYMQTLGLTALPTDFLVDIWSNFPSLIEKLFNF